MGGKSKGKPLSSTRLRHYYETIRGEHYYSCYLTCFMIDDSDERKREG